MRIIFFKVNAVHLESFRERGQVIVFELCGAPCVRNGPRIVRNVGSGAGRPCSHPGRTE